MNQRNTYVKKIFVEFVIDFEPSSYQHTYACSCWPHSQLRDVGISCHACWKSQMWSAKGIFEALVLLSLHRVTHQYAPKCIHMTLLRDRMPSSDTSACKRQTRVKVTQLYKLCMSSAVTTGHKSNTAQPIALNELQICTAQTKSHHVAQFTYL